jgi:hypothetical protein
MRNTGQPIAVKNQQQFDQLLVQLFATTGSRSIASSF